MAVRARATRAAARLRARLVLEQGGKLVGRGLAGLRRCRHVDVRRDLGEREALRKTRVSFRGHWYEPAGARHAIRLSTATDSLVCAFLHISFYRCFRLLRLGLEHTRDGLRRMHTHHGV